MDITQILVMLLVGGVAGWLATFFVKGLGFGLVGNIAVGIVGAVVSGYLLPRLGVSIGSGIIASIVSATIGAVILLFAIRLIRRG